MKTMIRADQNLYAACPTCGARIILKPNQACFGLWQGTAKCGQRAEAYGKRTTEPQPRNGIMIEHRGGHTD